MRAVPFRLSPGVLQVLRAFLLKILLVATLVISTGGCSIFQEGVSLKEAEIREQSANSAEVVKIIIDRNGLYSVNQWELQREFSDEILLQPDRWKLVHQGKVLNFWIAGDGKERTLNFYGWSNPGKYTRENTYWLMPVDSPATFPGMLEQSSLAPTRETSTVQVPSGAYLASVHLEENHSYLPQSDGEDHWFWQPLVAPNATNLDATLDAIAHGPARIRLSVWASSAAEQNPDHHLRILMNGELVADELWDGKGHYLVESEFSTDLLIDGSNKISIEAPGDTGAIIDVFHINWLKLDYSRSPDAIGDSLEFVYTGTPLAIKGFTQPVDVYDITDPYQVVRMSEGRKNADPFMGEPGDRYLVVESGRTLEPLRIEASIRSPDLRAPDAGADYVVIGPDDLIEAMQPLIDHRQSRGYRVAVITAQAIYDQFGYGAPEPEAIHAFLQYATASWQPAPGYLVLVGDASYDPMNYLGIPDANRLPASLILTEFGGETSSDIGYGQLDDDPWPDIAIGLIPARSPAQVTSYVEKVIKFEADLEDAPDLLRLLAVADGQDISFSADAQRFLDIFPASSYQTELYSPPAGASEGQMRIAELFEQGFSMIAYFGHGSIDMWGKDKLFTSQAVSDLSDLKRYPVVLNFTCLTGLYTHPKVDSLTETLLWQSDGGAIAVLAPSSLTLPYDQSFLSEALAQQIIANPYATIGELHLQARRLTPVDNIGGLDVMRTFMLFGDPAIRLAGE